MAQKLERLDPSLSITRVAAITKGERLSFQPAANLLPGMLVAYFQNGAIVRDTIVRVEKNHTKASSMILMLTKRTITLPRISPSTTVYTRGVARISQYFKL